MSALADAGDAVERRFVDQEHREILHSLGRVEEVAELAGSLAAVDLVSSVASLVHWLEGTVAPHMAWEEAWLFGELRVRTGSDWLARLLRFDHTQLRRAICALEMHADALRHEPRHGQLLQLRSDLYALDALLRAHLERETEFLLPALEATETMPAATRTTGRGS
jgi:hemerythrin-like domain-containing protein